jgi:bacillithiol synthase
MSPLPVTTPSLAPRARLDPRPEPPLDRFYDPLVDDVVSGGAFARERFATLWRDTEGLADLAASKRGPLPEALAIEMLAYHRRLGAGPRSIESLERLARGEAVCAVAGQQPGPLGGPLYSLHKTASAAALAAVAAERIGIPCAPLFWMHGEDSDFAEIRGTLVANRALEVLELEIDASAHQDGEIVGSVPVAPLREVIARALAAWDGLPGRADAERLLDRSLSGARDLGEAISALWLAIFEDRGLVVVDPRLPSFRAAARPLIDRYLANAAGLADAARRAGDRLEERFRRRPLDGPTLESFVFAIEDSRRRKVSPEEARTLPRDRALSPNVALRAALQDGVFPTIAMACGAAEVSYLAQLREVFEGVGVRAACPVPRLTATWLPPAAVLLLESASADPAELIAGSDAVIRRLAEREVPAGVRAPLDDARREANAALEGLVEAVRAVDASLPQMVESARGKVDYQYARLIEGVVGKVRHRLERQHPEWARLRYYVMPGDKLQERRLASMEVIAWRGARAAAETVELAEQHARDLVGGTHRHFVLDLA